MSIITQTITETSDVTIVTLPPDISTTTTEIFYTTVRATPGQSITFHLPRPEDSTLEPTKYTPTDTLISTTFTATELDVFLLDSIDNVFSTWKIDIPPPSPAVTGPAAPQQTVYIVKADKSGWNNWTVGEKVGLIMGVVLGSLFLLALVFCYKRRTYWVAHDWFHSNHAGILPTSTIQPTQIPGPLVPANATPYGYIHPSNGQIYGMRGGEGASIKATEKIRNLWKHRKSATAME